DGVEATLLDAQPIVIFGVVPVEAQRDIADPVLVRLERSQVARRVPAIGHATDPEAAAREELDDARKPRVQDRLSAGQREGLDAQRAQRGEAGLDRVQRQILLARLLAETMAALEVAAIRDVQYERDHSPTACSGVSPTSL